MDDDEKEGEDDVDEDKCRDEADESDRVLRRFMCGVVEVNELSGSVGEECNFVRRFYFLVPNFADLSLRTFKYSTCGEDAWDDDDDENVSTGYEVFRFVCLCFVFWFCCAARHSWSAVIFMFVVVVICLSVCAWHYAIKSAMANFSDRLRSTSIHFRCTASSITWMRNSKSFRYKKNRCNIYNRYTVNCSLHKLITNTLLDNRYKWITRARPST